MLDDTPLDKEEMEGEELPPRGRARLDGSRFEGPSRRKRRPASKARRFFVTLAAAAALGGLAAIAFLLNHFLTSDARFRIAGADNIEATGLTEVSRAALLPVFGEDIGRNIFFVPLEERRRQLEEIPWIEKATVMRLLPDRIRVSVVEREPVAFVRQEQQIGLVDASGVLLTMPAAMMSQRHYSFPVVTGIIAQDPIEARKARMAVYLRLMGELDANGQHLSEQISEIDLTDPHDARVLMPEQNGEILAHFGQGQFLERYQHYKAHINEWLQQYPKLASVDLRYEQQVVLEMAMNASQAASGEQSAGNASDSTTQSGQVAENGQVVGKSVEKQPSVAKAQKAAVKTTVNGSGKAKAATAKKSVKARKAPTTDRINAKEKKRAAGKRTAQKISQRKNAPTTQPTPSAGQGQ
jgi:cell division protein FtsQ